MSRSHVSVDLNRLIAQFPNYQDPNRVRADVVNVSQHHRTLVPTRGKLTLNSGQECELLMLEGTFPTFFRGQQYHTPVEIYLTENYPLSPPMCYIRPTPGMSLKKGHRHVDSGGLVYLPYLHEWASRSHNIVELVANMSSVFGAEPPLFVEPARSRPPPVPVGTTGGFASGKPQPSSYFPPLDPAASSSPVQPPHPNPAVVRREKEAELTRKLQGELQVIYTQLRTEMDSGFETQGRLAESQQEVEADLEEVSRRKKEMARLNEVAQERCLELDTYLEERKKEGEPCVDELIEPKDALSDQMLRLVAENAALEDALYYLDVGVTDGVITVEMFLREVRRLARKQFVARATMKKVERAQQELNAQRTQFNAQQAGRSWNAGGAAGGTSGGGGGGGGRYYPQLAANQNGQAGPAYPHMDGPPPGYTRTAVGGSSYNIGQPTAGAWGAAAGAARGGYPSFTGGYGQGAAAGGRGYAAAGGYGQTSYTQRR